MANHTTTTTDRFLTSLTFSSSLQLRVSIVITTSTRSGSIPNFTSSFLADPFDSTESPIVYQQYFIPHSTFLASLPLLSTYFPVLPVNPSRSGSKEEDGDKITHGFGEGDDSRWLEEFGIDASQPVAGGSEDKVVSAETGLKGLLEGLVVGLEVSVSISS